ncbi:MAG TPA: sugar phosphate isomerase/epimerase family protein [Verrucomicrobiae bacterium]|nr:sugar phosphate isomerase/epimerase family protein [Verrucomicrobiae bacterium]
MNQRDESALVPKPPRVSRRQALTALASGIACLSSAARAFPGDKNLLWKTAVGLNGFESSSRKYKKSFALWDILDRVSELGYDGIELVSDWPMGGYPRSTETDRIRALRRQYEGFGLQIFSIQLGVEQAFAPETATRRQWVEQFRDYARFARLVGCTCIGMWPGGGLRGQTLDLAIEHLAESFREAGKIAGDLGLTAAFEIEPPFVFNREEHLQRILAGANHPSLKVIYDPSHFDLMNKSNGRPHEMLQRIGVKNIGYVQLTDTDGTLRDGGTSKHLAVGDGHANIKESLRILRDGGFRGWIMVDAWEIPDPYDAAAKAKKAMDEAAREHE